jgi:hypothetical protein
MDILYYQKNFGARIQFIISETACQWMPINISKFNYLQKYMEELICNCDEEWI